MKTDHLLEIVKDPDYKIKYTHAKITNTCIRCSQSIKIFQDRSSELEYKISALCPKCQDDIFT